MSWIDLIIYIHQCVDPLEFCNYNKLNITTSPALFGLSNSSRCIHNTYFKKRLISSRSFASVAAEQLDNAFLDIWWIFLKNINLFKTTIHKIHCYHHMCKMKIFKKSFILIPFINLRTLVSPKNTFPFLLDNFSCFCGGKIMN